MHESFLLNDTGESYHSGPKKKKEKVPFIISSPIFATEKGRA